MIKIILSVDRRIQLEDLSLYIHIPFCKKKCYYCDFPSYSGKEGLIDDYVLALKKEIQLYAADLRDYKIQTIFIGGGTPSILKGDQIQEIIDCIKKNYNLDKNIEVSMEANPGILDMEKLEIYYNSGINRLSIGLQACQNNLLISLGRIHSYEDFAKNLQDARTVGFDNINVDLMFGLPHQKMIDWKKSLENIIKLDVPHISTYSLIVEEGTPFYQWKESGKINRPSEELELEMYHGAISYLKSNGYNHYEISNFAQKGYSCRHNETYWKNQSYLGLGSAAHSYFQKSRFSNFTDIQKYIEYINLGKKPIDIRTNPSIKDEISETMFLGLRMMEGISIEDFKKRFNKSPFDIYEKKFHILNEKKLLTWDENHIYLTPKGIDLANIVFQEMLLD